MKIKGKNAFSSDLKSFNGVAQNGTTQVAKNLSAMQGTGVQFLGQEDPLEKGMATHSCIHFFFLSVDKHIIFPFYFRRGMQLQLISYIETSSVLRAYSKFVLSPMKLA